MTPIRSVSLLIVASLAVSTAAAQTDTPAKAESANLFATRHTMYGKPFTLRANLLTPGIQAEWQFIRNKPFTLAVEIGLNSPLAHSIWIAPIVSEYSKQSAFESIGSYLTLPRVRTEGRYYYNLNSRVAKGKNTSFFSGNYIGTSYSFGIGAGVYSNVNGKTVTDWYNLRYYHSFSAYWGLQRHFGESRRWFFDAQLGVNYFFWAENEYYGYYTAPNQLVRVERRWNYQGPSIPIPHLKVGVGLRIR